MSKPKPGLGKGIVRTLVHSTSTSTPSSSLQLAPSITNGTSSYSTTLSTSPSGHYGSTSSRRDFGTIGLPNGNVSPNGGAGGRKGKGKYTYSTLIFPPSHHASSSSTSTTYPANSGVFGGGAGIEGMRWEGDKDIVIPFRPHQHASRRPSTPSSSSTRTPGGMVSSKRSLSTLSPPSYLFPPSSSAPSASSSSSSFSSADLFASIPSLDSIPLISTLLGQSNFLHPSSSLIDTLDLIVSPPSPPPSLRTRPNEVHPALTPFTPPYDTTLSSSFAQLGLPQQPTRHPVTSTAPAETDDAETGSSSVQLIFHLGASGLPKERPTYSPPKRASSSSPAPPPRPRSFPLPDVTPPEMSELRSVGVGEDAYFARMDGMCIADGVGGWAKSGRGGADAGRWSRLLTHFCEVELGMWDQGVGVYADVTLGESGVEGKGKGEKVEERGKEWSKRVWENAMDPKGGKNSWAKEAAVAMNTADAKGMGKGKGKRRALDPVEIMQRGFEKCLACFANEGIHGSSTCLLACLHDSTLSIANLGDCCLLLIRSNEIIFRTDEMQHAFNFPLQLGTHSRDEPMKDAKRYDVSVGKGDIVVLGSDGLMDNLFDEDILETLAQFTAPPDSKDGTSSGATDELIPFSPQKVSEALCQRAREISEQTSATTPFMVRAIEEGIDFVGGKKDDISVVVGVVGDRESGQPDRLTLHTR